MFFLFLSLFSPLFFSTSFLRNGLFDRINLTRPGAHANDHIASQIDEALAKAPEDLTEEDKMALLGRPKNGDIVRAQLRIKESKEFKVSVFITVNSSFIWFKIVLISLKQT